MTGMHRGATKRTARYRTTPFPLIQVLPHWHHYQVSRHRSNICQQVAGKLSASNVLKNAPGLTSACFGKLRQTCTEASRSCQAILSKLVDDEAVIIRESSTLFLIMALPLTLLGHE